MIKFLCPGCGQKLAVNDNLAGRRTKCPSCGDPVSIPHVSADVAPAPVPEPVFAPINAPPAPANPAPARAPAAFGFDPQPRMVPTALETMPSVTLEVDLTPSPVGMPRRTKRSPVKAWATWCAILGAVGGAALVFALKLTDEKMIAALGRMLQQAPEVAIRGAILGTLGGLAVSAMLLLLAGRSGTTIFGTLLLVAGGGVYGGIRKADLTFFELGLTMPVLGAVAGIVAGAILGAVIGGIIAANSGRKYSQPYEGG